MNVKSRKVVITMAKENVKKFYEKLANDKALREKLAKAQESYTGDLNDRQTIVETVFLPIAKEAGFDFTAEELKAAERELVEEKGISEEELENVSGGGGLCIFIGGGSDCSADGRIAHNGNRLFHACAFIGFGVDRW